MFHALTRSTPKRRRFIVTGIERRQDGAIRIHDALGRTHLVHDQASLWRLMLSLLDDKSIPEAERTNADEQKVEELLTKMVGNILPKDFQDFAPTAVRMGKQALRKVSPKPAKRAPVGSRK